MHSTEVTFDVCEVLVVDNVIEFHFESTLLLTCSCDILSILSAAQKHMELLLILRFIEWADGAVSAGEPIELMASDLIEGLWMEELAGSVTAGCVQHGKIRRDIN